MEVKELEKKEEKKEKQVRKLESRKILYGKKVILFPFEEADFSQFVDLLRKDSGNMMQYCLKNMTEEEAKKYIAALFLTRQIICWSVYIKKNSLKVDNKCIGFIYIYELEPMDNPHSLSIAGIMDTKVMKGLLKHIRRGTVTFAEDTLKTLCNYVFNEGINRITLSVLSTNRRSLALNKKCGFQKEGYLKEAFYMDNKFYDVILMAMLNKERKKEWK